MARRPKAKELKVLDEHVIAVESLLAGIKKEIDRYSKLVKNSKDREALVKDIDSLDSLLETHLKYSTKYAELAGIVELANASLQTQSVKEGTVISNMQRIFSDRDLITETFAKLFNDIGTELPSGVINEKDPVDEVNQEGHSEDKPPIQ